MVTASSPGSSSGSGVDSAYVVIPVSAPEVTPLYTRAPTPAPTAAPTPAPPQNENVLLQSAIWESTVGSPLHLSEAEDDTTLCEELDDAHDNRW